MENCDEAIMKRLQKFSKKMFPAYFNENILIQTCLN